MAEDSNSGLNSSLPFFYYDILSRIIPGAATLASISIHPSFILTRWLLNFLNQAKDEGSVEKLAVPVVLAGISYVIGTLYEVADFFLPIAKFWTRPLDYLAFSQALEERCNLKDEGLLRLRDDQKESFSKDIWDEFFYTCTAEQGNSSIFAHCHRFQAEHKMFAHLIYASLVLVVFMWWNGDPICDWIGFCTLIPIFTYASLSRNRRRWMQVIDFSRRMKIWETLVNQHIQLTTNSNPNPNPTADHMEGPYSGNSK